VDSIGWSWVGSARAGAIAEGWGETPLAVEWSWPSDAPYEGRHQAMRKFSRQLATAWSRFDASGHPLEVGHEFLEDRLPVLLDEHNAGADLADAMPRLAALVCASAFDLALHDAFGVAHRCSTYSTYNAEFMNQDLSHFLTPDSELTLDFTGRFPAEFLGFPRRSSLPAWHLVAGLDPIGDADVDPSLPEDDYPNTLGDWIRRDGLTHLKVKLRGNDAAWDYERLLSVARVADDYSIEWLSADFNCTVTDPGYVNAILDRLRYDHPRVDEKLLYVEQPFPYELEMHPIDVHSVSERKPLFLDESAHDWRMVEFGRRLGWSGVALKTCKTQTGALLSLCFAKACGMPLMVQDLTNPMLAQISHVLLAGHAGTIAGVETNGSQFFPDASAAEARIHPGLYRRRNGRVDLSTIGKTGLGYRLDEMERTLPEPAARFD
jgi:L-alanine-DL-glutamate epimerase-like enolase superfamily enzyme